AAQSIRVMLVEKLTEKSARILFPGSVFVTDSNIHQAVVFRKQPSIVRRNHPVKYHFDMIRGERHPLPPTHDGLQYLLLLEIYREFGMGAVCYNGEACAYLPSV